MVHTVGKELFPIKNTVIKEKEIYIMNKKFIHRIVYSHYLSLSLYISLSIYIYTIYIGV